MQRVTQNLIIGAIVFILLVSTGWYFWSTRDVGPRVVWMNADEDMIKLDIVKPGVTVLPQFMVTGEARGPWYFEASFPIEVLDKDGKQIAVSHAEAQSDWMTEEFVPFRGSLDLGDYSGPATLVLHKDNPSGLPEHDASVSIPIDVFDKQ